MERAHDVKLRGSFWRDLHHDRSQLAQLILSKLTSHERVEVNPSAYQATACSCQKNAEQVMKYVRNVWTRERV